MAQQAQQIDFTSVIAVLNAMSQVLGSNGKALSALLNQGIVVQPGVPANYTHIAGAGTFEAQTTAGVLLSLNINSGDAAGTGTIYDAAGTVSLVDVVAIIHFGTVAPTMVPLGPNERGLELNNGLVIVTTGTADVTFGSV